jgi:uncharacterized protein (DUF488 family)
MLFKLFKLPGVIMEKHNKTIWTIGHSTRSFDELLGILESFGIQLVADVRNFPGSRKFPQFNKEALLVSLPENHIQYKHFKSLGGRRKPNPGSLNDGWRSPAFRAYADYMGTPDFKNAVHELISDALELRTAFMCSEAVWWRCHRSLISDYVKLQGWKVMHIMAAGKATEHPYTQPAKIRDGMLDYSN